MKTRFLVTTAVGLVFATAAFAQSPSGSTTTSPATTTQTTPAPATQKTPDTSTTQAPASSSTATTPATSANPAQAQTTAPASSQPSTSPAQAQTTTPPPATNQAQQAPASGGTSTTAQPANTAQSSSTGVNASVNINDQQRTRVTESIARLNVAPINNVNFSLTVGTAIPRDIRVQTLPADVVEVVPQYRGYSFFAVRDEIVIVDPATYQIVTVLPRSGGARAAAPAPSHAKVAFTDRDRDVVRKHFKARAERQTTGSTAKVVIRRGERLPESVEIEEIPETVYRDAPALREYRYIHRDNRTYVVEPGERRVIEEID